jgi:hypothetical protein
LLAREVSYHLEQKSKKKEKYTTLCASIASSKSLGITHGYGQSPGRWGAPRGTLAGQEGSSSSAMMPISFRGTNMISRMVGATAVAALMFAAAPASAMKMASCNQKNMDKADAMLMKMPDGENKMMGMQEMTSAKSSMSQKDMAGCQDHMNKAMKMGMMKSKKM